MSPIAPDAWRFTWRTARYCAGVVEDYQPDSAGFFLTPVDSRSNNVRCFVGAAAITRASMG